MIKWVWLMGVACNIRRGFGVGLPAPETICEKLRPMVIIYIDDILLMATSPTVAR